MQNWILVLILAGMLGLPNQLKAQYAKNDNSYPKFFESRLLYFIIWCQMIILQILLN